MASLNHSTKTGPFQLAYLQVVVIDYYFMIRKGHAVYKPTTERFFFSSIKAKYLPKKTGICPSQCIIHKIFEEVF